MEDELRQRKAVVAAVVMFAAGLSLLKLFWWIAIPSVNACVLASIGLALGGLSGRPVSRALVMLFMLFFLLAGGVIFHAVLTMGSDIVKTPSSKHMWIGALCIVLGSIIGSRIQSRPAGLLASVLAAVAILSGIIVRF